MVIKLFDGKPGGGRRTGRPRLRWPDDAEAEMRTMGVNRTEWVAS
jgi:hypothetical protein